MPIRGLKVERAAAQMMVRVMMNGKVYSLQLGFFFIRF